MANTQNLGFDYKYNLNGRKINITSLSKFMYNRYSNSNVSKVFTNKDNELYDLHDLLKDIKKYYNKSYFKGFPVCLRMTVKKANKILQKKNIPFVIEEKKDDNYIDRRYVVNYVGEIKVEHLHSYINIYYLDSIYYLFNTASKFGLINHNNFIKLIKTIKDIFTEMSMSYMCCYLETLSGINSLFIKYDLPFKLEQKIVYGEKYLVVNRLD